MVRMARVTTVALAVCLAVGGCTGTKDPSPGRSQRESGIHLPSWRAQVAAPDQRAAFAHVTVVGGLVVVAHDHTVAVFDRRSGHQRWVRQIGTYDQAAPHVTVTTDVIAVSYGRSLSDALTVRMDTLDLATGRELWHRYLGERGEATVFRDAIYTAACTGTEGCKVTRRHPRTGQGEWTVLTASPVAEVEGAPLMPGGHIMVPASSSPPYLLLAGSHRDGYHVRLEAIVDSATGRLMPVPGQGQAALATTRTLVVADSDEDSCRTTLRGFDTHGGALRWRAEVFGFWAGGSARQGCTKVMPSLMNGGRALGVASNLLVAMSADRRPQVLDLDTGRRRWIASRPGVPVAVSDRIVVLRDTPEYGPIRALDTTTGRELWQSIDPLVTPAGAVAIADEHVVAAQNGHAAVLDAANGRALWWSQVGNVAGVGRGWLAVGSLGAGNEISYYAL